MRQYLRCCRMQEHLSSLSTECRGIHQRASQISLAALAGAFHEIGNGRGAVPLAGAPSSHEEPSSRFSLTKGLRAPKRASTMLTPPGGGGRMLGGAAKLSEEGKVLCNLTFAELLKEVGEPPLTRHFDRAVLVLHEIFFRLDTGSRGGDEIDELPLNALLAVLRILGSFGVGHLADGAAVVVDGDAPKCDRWVPKMIALVHASIARQCSSYSFASNVQVLHLLCRCEDFYFNDVLETLVDNILTAIRSGELSTILASATNDELSQSLGKVALLLDTIAAQCDGVIPLCTKQRGALRSLGAHRPGDDVARADQAPAEVVHTKVAQLLHHVGHPIANQAATELVLQHMTMLLGIFATRQCAPTMSPNSWFFLLRSLGKLPWISNSALTALFPLLRGVVKRDPSACKGVLFLLGRKDVTATDGELVASVLGVLLGDLRASAKDMKRTKRDGGARRLRYVELDKLSRFLPQAQHMLKVALESLLLGGGNSAAGSSTPAAVDQHGANAPSTSLVRRIQTSAKEMYVALCDDQMVSIASMQDLYHAKLADVVLYHLVCLAPRALIDHPFVLHLVYAMTQLCPSLRFMSDAAKHRIVSTVERLQERGILNDRFEMPLATIRSHPLMLAALVETLEFKRRSLIKRQEMQGSHAYVDPQLMLPYEDNPRMVERNAGIAFVSFRKLMERIDRHGN